MTPTENTYDKLQDVTIGTDIRFKIKISGVTQATSVNIQSVDVYFVRSEVKKQEAEMRKKFKFLRRYPIEPFVNDFRSTAHYLNNAGYYGYTVCPGIIAQVYDGFGVNPWHKFDPCPFPIEKDIVVKGKVYFTEDKSMVEVYFPAMYQKQTGSYDMIVRVRLYDSDYSPSHSRVITLRYNDFIVLKESGDSLPSGISVVEIDDSQEVTPTPDDTYVYLGELNDNSIDLSLTSGRTVPIDISNITDWYEGD